MYDLKESKKLQSSTEDRSILEDLEGSRPRTSKTALEAKDVLEAATSAKYIAWINNHLKLINCL